MYQVNKYLLNNNSMPSFVLRTRYLNMSKAYNLLAKLVVSRRICYISPKIPLEMT